MSDIVAVVETLQDHIKENIPDFAEVYAEFPRPDQELKLPSMSIITMGQAELTYYSPEVTDTVVDVVAGVADTTFTVGEYNLRLQADIWAEYKLKRGELYGKVDDLFSAQTKQGLSLNLPDAKGIARYEIIGYNFLDNEESSLKGEWRVSLMLQCHFDKLKTEQLPIMKEIEATVDPEEGV